MAWYDPILIFFFVAGLLLMALSSFNNKRLMYWGLFIAIATLIIRAFIWIESMI